MLKPSVAKIIASSAEPPANSVLPWHWHELNFRAMNTQISAKLYTNVENAAEILTDVKRMFHSFAGRLTRFHPESELSRLNESPTPFAASPTLFRILEAALWAAQATDGLFDPTILTNLEQAGYQTSFELVASKGEAINQQEGQALGHFDTITLNYGRRQVEKPSHIRLDLGGIGKGWAVDRTADRLNGLGPFLVNAGGDLVARGRPPDQFGWAVTITDPWHDDVDLLTLNIRDKAVATSSITRRRWQRGGRTLHHLIDPRTGQPAKTDLLSATVIGERVALAEVFAKTAIILGSQAGLDFIEAQPNIEACLITQDEALRQSSGFAQYLSTARA